MLAGPSPAQAASISGNTKIAARVVDIPTCHSPFESFAKPLKRSRGEWNPETLPVRMTGP
jgi:hypothetical protein